MSNAVRVVALVGAGRHPLTHRARRGPADACALELALRIVGAEVSALHAGDDSEPALREYLGMGAARVDVAPAGAGEDVVPVLARTMAALSASIACCGTHADLDEGSGCVPYALAARLDWPLVSEVAALERVGDDWRAIRALARGRRRVVLVRAPFVAVASDVALTPRPFAFARASAGRIERLPSSGPAVAAAATSFVTRPAARRAPHVVPMNSADRLARLLTPHTGGGETRLGLSAEEAAGLLLEWLRARGVSPQSEPGAHP